MSPLPTTDAEYAMPHNATQRNRKVEELLIIPLEVAGTAFLWIATLFMFLVVGLVMVIPDAAHYWHINHM